MSKQAIFNPPMRVLVENNETDAYAVDDDAWLVRDRWANHPRWVPSFYVEFIENAVVQDEAPATAP